MIVTDLNDRERKRHAEQLNKMASVYQELAAALLEGNDEKAGFFLAHLGLANGSISELLAVFSEAFRAEVPDTVPEQ